MNIWNAEVNKVPLSKYLVCDLRDVTLAHVRAITSQTAVGHCHPLPTERLVTNSRRVFEIIREEFGSKGFKLPGDVESDKPLKITVDNSRYAEKIKITPRPVRQIAMNMCNRLIELGLVRVLTARRASSSRQPSTR